MFLCVKALVEGMAAASHGCLIWNFLYESRRLFERACRICVFEKVAAVWRANVFCRRPFAGPDAKPRDTKLLSMTPALQVLEPPSVAQHNEAHSRSAHDFKGVVVLVCHRFF